MGTAGRSRTSLSGAASRSPSTSPDAYDIGGGRSGERQTSVYRIALPFARLPDARIVLTTDARASIVVWCSVSSRRPTPAP